MTRSSDIFCGIWLFVAALGPGAAYAQTEVVGTTETGSDSLLFQFNRSTTAPIVLPGPLFTVAVPEVPRANLRLQSTQFIPNFGRVEGLVDFANAGPSATPQRGRIAFSDVQVGSWLADSAVGDVPFDVYPLDFGVASLYRPLTGLRGANASVTRGMARLSVFGGRTTTINGFFGESVLVSDQTAYGARTNLRPSAALQVGVGFLHTSPTEALSAPTGSTSSMTVSTVYEATPAVRLFGEASMAKLGEQSTATGPSGWDASYLVGSRVRAERGRAELSVLRLGPGYAPLAYTNVSDRAGVFGSADYRVHRRLWVNGVFNRWSNNVREQLTRPSFEADHFQLGTRFQLGTQLFVNARVGEASAVTHRPTPQPFENRVRTFNADLWRLFGRWRLLGRATGVRTTSGQAAGSQRRRVDVEIRRTWPKGTGAWTTVGMLRERVDGAEATRSSLAGAAGLDWPARSNLSLYFEGSLNQELIVANAPTVRNLAVSGGLNWSLPRGYVLGLQGRFSRDTSGLDVLGLPIGPGDVADLTRYLLERSLDGHQFNIRIQKNLRWGSRPLLADADGGVVPARDFGHVAGIVFSDVNGDGTRSVAERGVANISVKLNGSLVTQVDENGRFEFRDVPVGRHTVELELRSVPATYDVGSDWRTVIDVAKRETTIPQFPLVLLGRVRGRVLVADAAVGGRAEPRPARNILVTLNDGLKTTITDVDGEFEFTSLPAGWYRVGIETASLPNFWTVAAGPIEPVVLEPGGRVSGLDLRVQTRPRPSRRVILQQADGETNSGRPDEP